MKISEPESRDYDALQYRGSNASTIRSNTNWRSRKGQSKSFMQLKKTQCKLCRLKKTTPCGTWRFFANKSRVTKEERVLFAQYNFLFQGLLTSLF
jgi:hypothetical protein